MLLKIRITGEGTKDEIIKALKLVINSLIDYDGSNPAQWEDPTLFTQISEETIDQLDPRLGKFQELLREAVHSLNEIPNTPIRSSKFRNSYEVANYIRRAIRS